MRRSQLLLAAVVLLATYLRAQQLLSQVLIDDEWHAYHRILVATYSQIFLSFGQSDYSIPLTLYYRFIADFFGLTEWGMRWPMLLAGIATVYLAMHYLLHHGYPRQALVFGLLLAISPLLINYSRIARPYALSLLCTLLAVVSFMRWYKEGHKNSAYLFVPLAIFGTWLHPVVGPLMVAPFLWAFLLMGKSRDFRQLWRVLLLGCVTALGMCLLILPPLLADPTAMQSKSGMHLPDVDTYLGALYLWLGTGRHVVLALSVGLALFGLLPALRAFPDEHLIIALGICLTLLIIYLSKPMWVMHALVMARYTLIICPVLLLWMAFGLVRLAGFFPRHATLVCALLCLFFSYSALRWTQGEILRYPNAYQSHSLYQMDWRHGHNPIVKFMSQFPRSPFWLTLAKEPRGSIRIAAGPYAFESYHNIFHSWQQLSRQHIMPARLQGYCFPVSYGESIDARFPFRNQWQADDLATLQKQHIDYVVLAKPQTMRWDTHVYPSSAPIDKCIQFFDARLGMRHFEDESIVVYKVHKP
ncbi:MAG: hypothetical protein RLZZ502_688 [Pseudomonadota bacterium]